MGRIVLILVIICAALVIGREMIGGPVRRAAPAPEPRQAALRPKDAAADSPWKYIIVHHSGGTVGSAGSFGEYHRHKGMIDGLAYHFVIGNGRGSGDGEVEIGERWTGQLPGGHVNDDRLNKIAIGVCLVGNFNETVPTEKQLLSLESLVKNLMETYDIPPSHVYYHGDVSYTDCPGRNFPARQFEAAIREKSSGLAQGRAGL